MTTLLLLLTLHGLFLAGLLGLFGRRYGRGNGVLAGVILLAALLLLDAYLGAAGISRRWPHVIGVAQPLWFLIGPLIYLYIVRFLDRRPRRRDALLALPAAAMVLWMLPFYRLGATDKLSARAHPWVTVAVYVAFSALTAACALRAWRALGEDAVAPPSAEVAPWRSGWLGFWMAALGAYAVLDAVGSVSLMVSGRATGIGTVSVTVLASIVYGTGMLVLVPDGLLARAPWPGKQKRASALPPAAARRYLVALERLMEDQRPWRDDSLGLGELAARLGISRHHLSLLLNHHLGTHFRDYVNRYRVTEAKRLLIDVGSRRSILDAGLDAGFASSATFYRAFKKHTGMTPKDFLAATAGGDAERFAARPTRR